MSRKKDHQSPDFPIPRDLDAGSAPDIHAELLKRLSDDRTALRVEFEGEGDTSPLSLQLVASAARSLAADRVSFGPAATAALQSLEPSKEDIR